MMSYDDLWLMMIYADSWVMNINDDFCWLMNNDGLCWFMINVDLWWLMINDDLCWSMINDDLCWLMLVIDDFWWFMIIYDDLLFNFLSMFLGCYCKLMCVKARFLWSLGNLRYENPWKIASHIAFSDCLLRLKWFEHPTSQPTQHITNISNQKSSRGGFRTGSAFMTGSQPDMVCGL